MTTPAGRPLEATAPTQGAQITGPASSPVGQEPEVLAGGPAIDGWDSDLDEMFGSLPPSDFR